ncbi:MAG: glycosyltransferase family 4 protein [bacterium]
MTIYFLINSLHTAGGTERVATIIANELSIRGYDIGLIALHGGGAPFFQINDNVKLHYVNPKGYKNIYTSYLQNVLSLHRLYKNNSVDIVVDVCSAMSLMSIPATIGLNTKVITWEHFNSNVDWNPITSPSARKLAKLFSTKIVTLTNQDKENYKLRYKAKNVTVISNPITINHTVQSNLSEKRILSIGRFTKQKGFDLLIHSWALLKNKHDGWKLRIIGHGELKNQLIDLIKELGVDDSVEILPPTTDVVSEYQNASIYVMSSRFEGLPLVLIEAMSMGLPIISFDCETGPRDVVDHQVTGVLVEPENIEHLAKAMYVLIRDKNRQLEYSRNAIVKSAEFDIDAIVKSWIDLFN